MATSDEGIRRGSLRMYLDGLLNEFGQVTIQTRNTLYSFNLVGTQYVLSEVTDEGLKPKYRGSDWYILSGTDGRLRLQIIDEKKGPVKTTRIKAINIPVEN